MLTVFVVACLSHGGPGDITQKYFNAIIAAKLNAVFLMMKERVFSLFGSLRQTFSD